MAKPKTRKPTKPPLKPTPKDEEAEPAIAQDGMDRKPTVLGAKDITFLKRANTFLINIPSYAGKAKLHGYTAKVHARGWELYDKAAGRDRPWEHWLHEHDQQVELMGADTALMGLLQQIDAFENRWFPRIKAIIPTVIAPDRVGRFTAAFFKDLAQQPLGPGVVDSVNTLLDRVVALKESAEPGAKALFEVLKQRGLTAPVIASERGLIKAAREAIPDDDDAPAVSKPEDLAKAREEQLAALAQLKLWLKDWATTFRDVFGVRVRVKLGLTKLRRGKSGEEEAEDDLAEGEETSDEETSGEETSGEEAG